MHSRLVDSVTIHILGGDPDIFRKFQTMKRKSSGWIFDLDIDDDRKRIARVRIPSRTRHQRGERQSVRHSIP